MATANTTDIVKASVAKHLIKWTKEHEELMVDWADKAMCYRWLHAKSNKKLTTLNTWFTIPVIIMSTVTGTANFAQEKFPEATREYVPMLIGGVNIVAGIITTVQQFLKIGELNEAHRIASLSWDKFYRKIRIELAKSPDERINITDFLKTCAEDFDRLMEISPVINEKIIQQFRDTFLGKIKIDKHGKEILTKQQELFYALKKPEICDSLVSVSKFVYNANNANNANTPLNLSTVDNTGENAEKNIEICIESDKKTTSDD